MNAHKISLQGERHLKNISRHLKNVWESAAGPVVIMDNVPYHSQINRCPPYN